MIPLRFSSQISPFALEVMARLPVPWIHEPENCETSWRL